MTDQQHFDASKIRQENAGCKSLLFASLVHFMQFVYSRSSPYLPLIIVRKDGDDDINYNIVSQEKERPIGMSIGIPTQTLTRTTSPYKDITSFIQLISTGSEIVKFEAVSSLLHMISQGYASIGESKNTPVNVYSAF